jgi:hypothetical protein
LSTDVSEEHIASIFRVEEIISARKQQKRACHLLPCWFLAELVSSTLKMEVICSSERSVDDVLHGVISQKMILCILPSGFYVLEYPLKIVLTKGKKKETKKSLSTIACRPKQVNGLQITRYF